jgi:hypothetical protein
MYASPYARKQKAYTFVSMVNHYIQGFKAKNPYRSTKELAIVCSSNPPTSIIEEFSTHFVTIMLLSLHTHVYSFWVLPDSCGLCAGLLIRLYYGQRIKVRYLDPSGRQTGYQDCQLSTVFYTQTFPNGDGILQLHLFLFLYYCNLSCILNVLKI